MLLTNNKGDTPEKVSRKYGHSMAYQKVGMCTQIRKYLQVMNFMKNLSKPWVSCIKGDLCSLYIGAYYY